MAEEDATDDVGAPEMVPDVEKASPQTVALSEKVSKKALKAAMKVLKKPKDPPKVPGDSAKRPRGAPSPTFKAVFDDYIHGMTPEAMQEKYKLTEKTMKQKMPELELAKRRVIEGLRQRGELPVIPAQAPPPPQTVAQALAQPASPSQTAVHAPAQPPATPNPAVGTQNPPGTYTVPAIPAGNALAVAGGGGASKTPSGSVEDGAGGRGTAPQWLRHDGGELVNTIEMGIRGVQSKETFSPITIVLLSYLKYLGGDEMTTMSFGDMVDYTAREPATS